MSKYLFSTLNIWKWNMNSFIKSTCSLDSWIKTLLEICSTYNYNVITLFKTIHLCQKLIQCCIAVILFICCTSISSYGIYFIYKNDGWSTFSCLVKEFLHCTSSRTNIHIIKFRSIF